MPALDRDTSALLVVDFQTRLMPAIEDSAAVVANARRLLERPNCSACRRCSPSRTRVVSVPRCLNSDHRPRYCSTR
jgi:hypothetical protein